MQADARPIMESEEMRLAREEVQRAEDHQRSRVYWNRELKGLWWNVKVFAVLLALLFVVASLVHSCR